MRVLDRSCDRQCIAGRGAWRKRVVSDLCRQALPLDVVHREEVLPLVFANFGDGDDHRLPFQGEIDWYKFVEALHRNGYKGVFTMELRNYGNMADTLCGARESFGKLETHYRSLGVGKEGICPQRSR